MLETQPDFAIVGLAASGAQAVALAGELRPDVIVLDWKLPELDGVAALRAIRAGDPSRALIFTAFDTDERILAAAGRRAGLFAEGRRATSCFRPFG